MENCYDKQLSSTFSLKEYQSQNVCYLQMIFKIEYIYTYSFFKINLLKCKL